MVRTWPVATLTRSTDALRHPGVTMAAACARCSRRWGGSAARLPRTRVPAPPLPSACSPSRVDAIRYRSRRCARVPGFIAGAGEIVVLLGSGPTAISHSAWPRSALCMRERLALSASDPARFIADSRCSARRSSMRLAAPELSNAKRLRKSSPKTCKACAPGMDVSGRSWKSCAVHPPAADAQIDLLQRQMARAKAPRPVVGGARRRQGLPPSRPVYHLRLETTSIKR